MPASLAAFALAIFFALPAILAMLAVTHAFIAAVQFVRSSRAPSRSIDIRVLP